MDETVGSRDFVKSLQGLSWDHYTLDRICLLVTLNYLKTEFVLLNNCEYTCVTLSVVWL